MRTEAGSCRRVEVKKKVKRSARQILQTKMKEKSALGLHSERKTEIGRERLFDNTRGS